jgi:hypothetical protein
VTAAAQLALPVLSVTPGAVAGAWPLGECGVCGTSGGDLVPMVDPCTGARVEAHPECGHESGHVPDEW